MNRKLLVPTLAAMAMLAGCATGYQYRSGYGDYYYGQPSVEYRDYGYDGFYGGGYPGGWGGSLGFGYGYGGWGYGYPYWGYGYPWYYNRPHGRHHHHDGHDEPDSDDPPAKPTPPPRVGIRPPARPLLPGPRTRTPRLVRDESRPVPPMAAPTPARPVPVPGIAPRIDRGSRDAMPSRSDDRPRFQPQMRMGEDRDGRRKSTR